MQLDINKLITAIEGHTDYTLNLEAAGRGTPLPYVVWELLGSRPDIAMGGTQNVEIVTFRLSVYGQTCDSVETVHTSIAGSFDEGALTITDYTNVRCQRTNSTLRFRDGTWLGTLTYELWAQEK